MLELDLAADDAISIRRLARSVGREYGSSDDAGLLRDLEQLAQEMPATVASALRSHLGSPEADVVVIHNHMVSDVNLGPTPTDWKAPRATATSLEYEMLVMLYGSLLGSVFGWATQQDGHIVNDIIPIASFSDQQVGASSKVELAWHTEDAFHPGRADYICLFCLRNPSDAPTTVASLIEIRESETLPTVLFEPCVRIAADDAQAAGARQAGMDDRSPEAVEPVPILSRNGRGLEMCIDPAYMSLASEDELVREGVTGFCRTIEEHLTEVVLRPGDLLVLDNHRAVHGRRPFKPTYGGRDRWLKRVNVATDFASRAPYCTDPDLRLLA